MLSRPPSCPATSASSRRSWRARSQAGSRARKGLRSRTSSWACSSSSWVAAPWSRARSSWPSTPNSPPSSSASTRCPPSAPGTRAGPRREDAAHPPAAMASPMKRPATARADEEEGSAAKRAAAQPKLKLIYFDIGGKGDPLRLAMSYAGLDFEDCRRSREQIAEMKTSGELAFGQVPALVVEAADGQKTTLVQTAAIIRYIGKLAGEASGLYPADAVRAAQVDAMVDQASDMMAPVLCAKYQERFGFDEALGGPQGEGTSKVEHALQTSVMPRHFGFFEKILEGSKSGWIAGTERPSIADFILGVQFKQLGGSPMVKGEELLAQHPKLTAFVERFHALPAVRAWYEGRAAP
mmetsp:Transcript_132518/g.342885  ORF Transcript_132518/g.342885 Transcript_132518/m.342885 type:complete len:352 (+) Transcript_132518:115-1170(+)